jgi:hypothetical protein
MSDWVLAAFLGVLGVAGIFGLASMKGISPRRLAWQDLSRVRVPSADERALLRSHVKQSLRVYLPVLAAAVIVGGYMIVIGSPFGLTVLLCFGTPPLLAIVRAVRVMRFLDETA